MLTDRISVIWVALFCPDGQLVIFAEQFGAGLVQLKVAPGGVEVSVILVVFPLHRVPE